MDNDGCLSEIVTIFKCVKIFDKKRVLSNEEKSFLAYNEKNEFLKQRRENYAYKNK